MKFVAALLISCLTLAAQAPTKDTPKKPAHACATCKDAKECKDSKACKEHKHGKDAKACCKEAKEAKECKDGKTCDKCKDHGKTKE